LRHRRKVVIGGKGKWGSRDANGGDGSCRAPVKPVGGPRGLRQRNLVDRGGMGSGANGKESKGIWWLEGKNRKWKNPKPEKGKGRTK